MLRQYFSGRRAAFTLVELLIVIGIMLVMTAIALPQLKTTLDDNKLREGSRQVSAFFAQARARAASTGRPCGVWMESTLVPGANYRQSTRLAMCEVPPTYAGDTVGATIALANDGMGGIQQRSAPTGDSNIPQRLVYDGAGNPRTWYVFDVGSNVGLFTILDQKANNGSGNFYAMEPFTIRFGYRGLQYQGIRYNDGGNDQIYLVPEGGPLPNNLQGPGRWSTFQVTRRPRRVGVTRDLPQGIAIDMGYSGMGLGNNTYWGYQPQPFSAPNIWLSYGQEFGVGLDPASGSPPEAMQDNGADKIVVMFSPGGSVQQLFIGTVEGPPSSTLYFLVGRTERVGKAPFFANYNDMRESSNIVDNNSLWITVGRMNGTISTSDNTPPLITATSAITTPVARTAFLTVARDAARQYALTRGQ